MINIKSRLSFINKTSFLFLLTFLFALAIRLVNIDINPIAISHDELDYVLNGKTIALTGSDLTGEWTPLSFSPIETETLTSELFPVLQSIPNYFLPLGLFEARLLSVIISALTVALIGLLVFKLTNNQNLGLSASLAYALNPWSILFSHTAYEAPASIFFYLLGIHLLLEISKQKNLFKSLTMVLFSVISFTLGLYTYHGYKIIFPFLVAIPFLWQWFVIPKKEKKKIYIPYLIFTILIGILSLLFIFSLSKYGGRQSELLFSQTDFLSGLVNSVRRLGFNSPYASIFINKYSFLIREIAIRYFNTFNPVNLFITGNDSTILFSLQQVGYLHLIDLPLIIIGVFFLFSRFRKFSILIFLLLLISPIPASIHSGTSTALRAGFIFPLLTILSGSGLYFILQLTNKSIKNLLIKFFMISLLLINFSYFWYSFQNNYPIYSADNYFFKERLLSEYSQRIKDKPVVILTSNPYPAFRAYLFYNNLINNDSIDTITDEFKKGINADYSFEEIVWTSDCQMLFKSANHTLIVEAELIGQCEKNNSGNSWQDILYQRWGTLPTFIASPIDSRGYYQIFNSSLCQDVQLNSFIHLIDSDSTRINNLENKILCEKLIIIDNSLNTRLINLKK
ncbi:MAG: YfhO family protein [Candidatus Pacebacteria bacterium]|nr:YfhO family protein [Candidatus Paceibacterota bacterium]